MSENQMPAGILLSWKALIAESLQYGEMPFVSPYFPGNQMKSLIPFLKSQETETAAEAYQRKQQKKSAALSSGFSI